MRIDDLSGKYHGKMAETYDSQRVHSTGWQREQQIVEQYLDQIPVGSNVLDVPIGTGRFLEKASQLSFNLTGVDVSSSMLDIARAKAASIGLACELELGSIDALGLGNNSFDVVICMRFMNWVSLDFMKQALSELKRVCGGVIIVYIPTYSKIDGPFSVTGFSRWLRQHKRRFYNFRTRAKSLIHEGQDVEAIFRELTLQVDDCILVNQSQPQRVYDRNIFFLQAMH